MKRIQGEDDWEVKVRKKEHKLEQDRANDGVAVLCSKMLRECVLELMEINERLKYVKGKRG